jgi:UDP-2,3-diacylglucosamine hydrolase
MSGTALILSDVHLRDASSVKTRLVQRFLQEKASQFKKIYILGDLFDVWPGTNDFLLRAFQPILDTLKALVKDGHEVHYVEGNHDFKLGSFFTESLGVQVYEREIIENWNGKKIYMQHGDLGNPKEIGYRALRYVLRHDVTQWVAGKVPGEWVYNIGNNSSQFSRNYQKKQVPRDEQVRGIYRVTAQSLFRAGYDVVLMGHTHIPDDFTEAVDGRTCRYLNSGDWVRSFTYLEYDGSDFHRRTHPMISA